MLVDLQLTRKEKSVVFITILAVIFLAIIYYSNFYSLNLRGRAASLKSDAGGWGQSCFMGKEGFYKCNDPYQCHSSTSDTGWIDSKDSAICRNLSDVCGQGSGSPCCSVLDPRGLCREVEGSMLECNTQITPYPDSIKKYRYSNPWLYSINEPKSLGFCEAKKTTSECGLEGTQCCTIVGKRCDFSNLRCMDPHDSLDPSIKPDDYNLCLSLDKANIVTVIHSSVNVSNIIVDKTTQGNILIPIGKDNTIIFSGYDTSLIGNYRIYEFSCNWTSTNNGYIDSNLMHPVGYGLPTCVYPGPGRYKLGMRGWTFDSEQEYNNYLQTPPHVEMIKDIVLFYPTPSPTQIIRNPLISGKK